MTSQMFNTPTRLAMAETERLVNRLKNSNPEKFESMVKMHLSFLLDLSGSQLEEFLDPESTIGTMGSNLDQRARFKGFSFSKKKALKEKEIKSQKSVFGKPLSQQSIELIFPLIENLHRPECLAEEGLFRKSGQATRQRNLQDSVDCVEQMEQLERELENGSYTAHDCASGLKIFLRELPEPLLTNKHYVAYCQIPGMKSQTKQLHSIQLLLQLLPQPNYVLLQLLLHLLHRVAQEPHNKMTADTLATLFAPHVLVPRSTHAHDLQAESCSVTQVVAFMIENFRVLFMPPEPLVRDIRLFWAEMEGANQSTISGSCDIGGMTSEDELDECTCPRFKRKLDPQDDAIKTTVCFADREASIAASDFTSSQVAQLYAYVSCMPDSPKKRKLVKQFNKYSNGTSGVSTPQIPPCDKHRRCITDSLKKIMTPGPRRSSYDVTKEQPSDHTPRNEKTNGIGTPLHMSGCRLRQKHLLRREKLNTSTDTEISVTSSNSASSASTNEGDFHSSMPLLNDAMLSSPTSVHNNMDHANMLTNVNDNGTPMNAFSENNVCCVELSQQQNELGFHKISEKLNLGEKYVANFASFLHNPSPIPCINDIEDKENASSMLQRNKCDIAASTVQRCPKDNMDYQHETFSTACQKVKQSNNHRVISMSAPSLSKPIRT